MYNKTCDFCDSRFLTSDKEVETCPNCAQLITSSIKVVVRHELLAQFKKWDKELIDNK